MIQFSETMLKRCLQNCITTLQGILESGDEKNKIEASVQLAHLIMNIHRLKMEEENQQMLDDADDIEGEEWKS